ncbi:MAG TPA: transposase [Armatimonadota bacterium]|nr:transposase [Armatimonadota bacterium]
MTGFEHLRHVRGRRVHAVDGIYHLRTSTIRRTSLLADDACKEIVRDTLQRVAAVLDFDVLAYVIMPDHVHLLIQPHGASISKVMASFKRHSARNINKHLGRKGQVWREEFFDHMLRTNEHLEQLADYIHDNPVRRGLAPSARDWPFSSWHEVYGDSGFPGV